MILRILHSSRYLRKNYFEKWGINWTQKKIRLFKDFLNEDDQIIDIGSGNCLLSYQLQQIGYQVSPIDISNLSYSEKITPLVYNGNNIPFDDKHFDTALLLAVLHHAKNPKQVLEEAKRVARKIIIIEDIYNNKIQQALTYAIDAFINLAYSPLSFHHRTHSEWLKIFATYRLEVKEVRYRKVLLIFKQAIYYLESNET